MLLAGPNPSGVEGDVAEDGVAVTVSVMVIGVAVVVLVIV